MIYKNFIGIDTVQAFYNTTLDTNSLINKGWRYWPKNRNKKYADFNIQEGNLRFKYIPDYNYLSIKFSAAKVQNGANSFSFNFSDIDLLKQYINIAINTVLPPNSTVPEFDKWTVNEFHTFIDYKFNKLANAQAYHECIAKSYFKRCKNNLYKTGNQARNKSYSNNIYIKECEIEYRLKEKPEKVNQIEKEVLKNNIITLRYEVQAKKSLLQTMFGKNRKVRDILSLNTCKIIMDYFIIKNGFNHPFLYKSDLFHIIDTVFSKTKSKNLKKFLQVYNSKDLEETQEIYSKSMISNYISSLRSVNLNPIYLSTKTSELINFLNYTSISADQFINEVIEEVIEIMLKELKILAVVTYCTLSSIIIKIYYTETYYYEEDG